MNDTVAEVAVEEVAVAAHPMRKYMAPKQFNRFLTDTVVDEILASGLKTLNDMKKAHLELGMLIESIEAMPKVEKKVGAKRGRRSKAEIEAANAAAK
jgi:hypothetical protein